MEENPSLLNNSSFQIIIDDGGGDGEKDDNNDIKNDGKVLIDNNQKKVTKNIEANNDGANKITTTNDKNSNNNSTTNSLQAMTTLIDNTHDMTEIIEFAKYLGIDPGKESSLLWIAQEAINAALPTGWTDHTDENGNVYFYNTKTKESTWTHPLDDHYKRLVQRLKHSGGQVSAKVHSPVISPKQKLASLDFSSLQTVTVFTDEEDSKNNNKKKYRKTSTTSSSRRERTSSFLAKKKRSNRKIKKKRSIRRSSRHNITDDSDFDSLTSETDYTSNTDYYDTDHTDIESSRNYNKNRNKHHGRINSPLLRRSSSTSSSSHRKNDRRASRNRERNRIDERRISMSAINPEDQIDMGTKSKDELQKLISMAKAQGKDPTDLAVRVLFRDPKIKCLFCCGCFFLLVAIITFLIWKFYF